MAKRMHTSRAALDRLLDPANTYAKLDGVPNDVKAKCPFSGVLNAEITLGHEARWRTIGIREPLVDVLA